MTVREVKDAMLPDAWNKVELYAHRPGRMRKVKLTSAHKVLDREVFMLSPSCITLGDHSAAGMVVHFNEDGNA